MRDIKISEQYSTEVSKSSIVKLEENNAPYVKASSLKENRLFENRKIGQMENKSLSLTNLKITEDGVKNSERALYWLFIVLGFLVVLGVEIVLKPSSAIVGILIAIAILAFLILIYKLLSKDKQGGKIGMKPYKTILIF